MKRITVLLVLFLVAVSTLRASTDILRIGVSAGGNITRVSGHGPGFMHTGWQFDSSGGYFMGLTARVSIPIVNIGFDGSFLYSQETIDIRSNYIPMYDRMRFFSIPLHVRYDFELPLLTEVFVPYVFMGPQLNLTLNDFDWYNVVRHDQESFDDMEIDNDNRTDVRTWKYDLGFGFLLGGRVQIAYNYAIPLNSTFGFRTLIEEGRNNFHLGTHRIGATFYF